MHGLLYCVLTHIMSNSWSSVTYVVGVESCCFGSSCIEQTSFKAIVDSGTSFTFLPDQIYDRVVKEVSLHLLAAYCTIKCSILIVLFLLQFDRKVNATKASFEGYPWQYCYKSR